LTLTQRALRRVAPERRPLDVAEIGFGRGDLLSRFLAEGHRVTGIDLGILEADIEPSLRARGTLHLAAVEDVTLPDQSADLIYAIHVVEHLRDPGSVFAMCRAALRDDGVLYLMTPNGASAGLRAFGEAWWNLEDPTHVRFFSPRSIAHMLGGAGLEVVSIRAPMWDSLTMEQNSLLRTVRRDPTEHGVLGAPLAVAADVALLPVALGVRAVWPALTPSMEVVARPATARVGAGSLAPPRADTTTEHR
jgi:SAM-dependent methyltransferase